jgi:hypothetical protein
VNQPYSSDPSSVVSAAVGTAFIPYLKLID